MRYAERLPSAELLSHAPQGKMEKEMVMEGRP